MLWILVKNETFAGSGVHHILTRVAALARAAWFTNALCSPETPLGRLTCMIDYPTSSSYNVYETIDNKKYKAKSYWSQFW